MVFRAPTETNGPVRLYAVPIGGGIVSRLSHDTTDANAFVSTFAISPESNRVVFVGPLESDGIWRIYSNLIPGI